MPTNTIQRPDRAPPSTQTTAGVNPEGLDPLAAESSPRDYRHATPENDR